MHAPSAVLRARADLGDLLSRDARLHRLARAAALWLVPLMLLTVFVFLGTGPDGIHTWAGDLIGSDFTQVWVAGRKALAGQAAEAYDLSVHLANLRAAFGPECLYAWHYPPVFFLPSALAGLLPFRAALVAWMLVSLALIAAALVVATGRRDAVLIGLAHPLVFCNLAYGQNGLVTAGLLTFGAMLVDRRPILAGLCFGLVAYKPQLAALAPCLLLVTGRWRCLGACLLTVLGLCLAALAAFGPAPWQAFLATLGQTNHIILEQAEAGLGINASAFGAIRLAGGAMAAAWTFQAAIALLVIGVAARVWLRCGDVRLRAATLLGATPLLSPYVPIYDLAPLLPATALLVVAAGAAGGLRPAERALLLVAPLLALIRPATEMTGLPFGFLFALLTFGCLAARALPLRPTSMPRSI